MSTKVADYSAQKKAGCGIHFFYNGVFGGRRPSFMPRRTSSTSSIPMHKLATLANSKTIRRGGSDVTALLDTSNLTHELTSIAVEEEKPTKEVNANHPRTLSPSVGTSSSSSNSSTTTTSKVKTTQRRSLGRRSYSGELHSMTSNHQLTKQSSTALVRTSSVMHVGHLGNIIQPQNSSQVPGISTNRLDYKYSKGNCNVKTSLIVGNTVRSNDETQEAQCQYSYLSNALSKRLDPEELKVMGNEEYKKRRFATALALYDRAIALNPNKATYRSNKSAALTGLGRLLGAVIECKEAIRIEPCYERAHHRLGTLYMRLGEIKKALHHLRHSGPQGKQFDVMQAETLESLVDKCNEARALGDWTTVLKKTKCALALGADSALQMFSLQAEALLKLHRHEDADTILKRMPVFEIDDCTKIFGPVGNAQMLVVRAQIDMAAGRFEEAVGAVQQAVGLDSSNKELSCMMKTTIAVASSRSTGNHLYKASKFLEASMAYTEGLEPNPFNSVLLCNRAACRFKLGQFEKAVEDCTNALNLRPSYAKARLRRADCNAKMERWEASIQDYEMLIRETPVDEEIGRALFESQVQLRKQRGEDVTGLKFGADVTVISNNERFRHYVTSPGVSVVLFSHKWSNQQALQHMSNLSKTHPSIKFLKVEVEEHPYLAKSEGVRSVPAFKIYKNGSRIKDIPGNNHELLENSVQFYAT